ncbi:MAG: hypothetical protein PHF29_08040 [Candidatus Riflebacteria bacterium]|nr:hypothetical protein [Candidatus Riflebacteria bacterium]
MALKVIPDRELRLILEILRGLPVDVCKDLLEYAKVQVAIMPYDFNPQEVAKRHEYYNRLT